MLFKIIIYIKIFIINCFTFIIILIKQKDIQINLLRKNADNFNNLNNILNNIYLIDEKIKKNYLLIEKGNKLYKKIK